MVRKAKLDRTDSPTLEERLHEAHDAFMLIGDFFELLASGADEMRGDVLSAAGCQTAAALCRARATSLRQTLDTLPAHVANWSAR